MIFPKPIKTGAQAGFAPGSVLGRFYYPELDALRFLAFLLVFLHHAAPREIRDYEGYFPAGIADALASAANMLGCGLSLFFFLSAFLITELLAREKSETETVKIGDFYIRRCLRIWPLYFLGIVIGVAAAIGEKFAGASGDYGNLRMLIMYLALSGNWYFASGITAWPDNPMTPLWSISVEEQFYLFWPAVMRFASRRALFGLCGIMATVAIGAELFLGCIHANVDAVIWTNSLVQFEMFAAGAALALFLRGSTPRLRTKTRLALAAVAASTWFASAYWFRAKYVGPAPSGAFVVIGYLFIASGCAAVMLAVLGVTRKVPPFLIYLGRISFGLYVFHLLAIQIVAQVEKPILALSGWCGVGHLCGVAASLLLTIVMAALSYRFLEMPFLRLKERFAVVASRPI
ncbi:MAG: acyltransferase family protein [Methylocella sp.]